MSNLVSDAPRETILLVEDEVLVRTTLSRHIRECGYRVFETNTPDEALTMLSDPDFDVDAVFIAMQFEQTKEMFTLAHWVREHRPGVNVILAGNLASAAEKARALCGQRPAPQTFTSEEVVREIRRLLASRAGMKKTETADVATSE